MQISFGDYDGGSAKLTIGTLYSLAKPLEKKAAQNGESLTITAYGKLIAEGKAGHAHHFSFEIPDEDPKHTPYNLFLAKTAIKKDNCKNESSGNFFSNFTFTDEWEGACLPIWQFAYDPIRHSLSAKKPFVVINEQISLQKGIPLKILWRKNMIVE